MLIRSEQRDGAKSRFIQLRQVSSYRINSSQHDNNAMLRGTLRRILHYITVARVD